MKTFSKKLICVFIALVLAFSSVSVSAFASQASDYPDGVTAAEASTAVGATDRLVASVCKSFMGNSLKSAVTPMIYSSGTLSQMLVGIYSSVSANASEISSIGIDVSPKAVGEALSAYKNVSKVLKNAEDWSSVKLDGVSWGVSTKSGFVNAVAASFGPFNDVLYMLLCSGTYKISSIISIKGDNGYQNAIVPLLNSLGCTGLLSQEAFSAAASKNKNTMVANIAMPLMNWLEKACGAPAQTLTKSLPSFAYFEESGQLDSCIDALVKPITDNTLVKIATFLKIVNLDSLDFDINSMLSETVGNMASEQGFKLAEIDLKTLSQCGTASGNSFTADSGKAYVAIMRWLINSLKLNSASLPKLMSSLGGKSNSAASSMLSADSLSGILSKDTDTLLGVIISLFSPSAPESPSAVTYKAVTPATVSYSENLGESQYKKALGGIDEILDEFIGEYSDYDSVSSMLSQSLYTNANINSLMTTVYSYIEKQGLTEVLSAIGINTSPKGVAALLTENGYSSVRNRLQKASAWSKVSLSGATWNFYNGSKTGFENALTAVLRPLFPALRLLLAGEDLTVLGSITLKGADGYNSAVIPLLEALGCKASEIKSYKQYIKNAGTDGVIKDILDPIFSLVGEIGEKPVYTLTKILPNIVAFMDGDSLTACLNNLMLPLTGVTKKLSAVMDNELPDISKLTKELDISKLAGGLTSGLSIKLPEKIDFAKLATYGEAKTKTSKQVLNDSKVKYTYIKSDQTAVFITILRFLVDTLKLPDNQKALSGLMSSGGSAGAFAGYTSSFTDQFEKMTTDEVIEWLYNLLFKERATVQTTSGEIYSPTIIFEKQKKNYTWLIAGGAVLGVALIAGALIFANRKRLFEA